MNIFSQHNITEIDKSKILDDGKIYNNKSFNGYKKTSVFTELNNCLLDNRLENVCFWTAEIHCSGYLDLLWEKIIIFSSKHININNPLLPKYLYTKYENFKCLKNTCNKNNIDLRNNLESRKELCEILTVLCLSKKINIPKIPKIYVNDFNIENIQHKLQATNTHTLYMFFRRNDPLELKIPINELVFNIQNKNLNNSVYWISWIIEYENKVSKNDKLICENRNICDIEDKYKTDISWLIWNAIFSCCKEVYYSEQIQHIYKIYKLNFTKSKKKTRISLFVHSILLIIEKIDHTIPIKNREDIISSSINHVNIIYEKIQNMKNEDLNNIKINSKQPEKNESLTEKILKKKKNNNNISDISQNKLDIIMNITNNICN